MPLAFLNCLCSLARRFVAYRVLCILPHVVGHHFLPKF